MRSNKFLWIIIPSVAITAGCVYSHQPATYTRTGTVVTTGPAVAVATPPSTVVATSPRSAVRVYPDTKLSITSAEPPPAPVSVPITVVGAPSANDAVITTSIKQMLETDSTRLYRNVDFAIDNGKVTLRGSVPTDHDRVELQNRLAAMPGVISIDNKLDVEWR